KRAFKIANATEESNELILLCSLLGEINHLHEKLDISEKYYSQGLHLAEKMSPDDHLQVAQFLNSLGTIRLKQSKFDQAHLCFMRAIKIRERELGPSDSALIDPLHGAAICHEENTEFDRAEEYHLRAMTIAEDSYEENDPEIAFSLEHLASFLCASR